MLPRVLTTPTDLGEEVQGVQRGEPDLAARTLRSQAQTIRAVIARRARLHVAGHLWSPHLAQSLQTAITTVHPDVEASLGDLRDLCQAHAHRLELPLLLPSQRSGICGIPARRPSSSASGRSFKPKGRGAPTLFSS